MPSADPGADVRVQPQPLLNGTATPTPAAQVRNQPAPIIYNGDTDQAAANAQILLKSGWRAGDRLEFNVAYPIAGGTSSDNCFDAGSAIGFSNVPTVTSSVGWNGIPWAQNNNDPDPDNYNGTDGAGVLPVTGAVAPTYSLSLASSSASCSAVGVQDILVITFTNQSATPRTWFELTVSDIAYDVGATVPTGTVRNGVFATSAQAVVVGGVVTTPTAYGYNDKANNFSMTQWTNTAFVSGFKYEASGVGSTTVDASNQYITTILLDELRVDGLLSGDYRFRVGQWDPAYGAVTVPTVDNLSIFGPSVTPTGSATLASTPSDGDNTFTVTVTNATNAIVDVSFDVRGRVVAPGLITVELIGWAGDENYVPDDQQLYGVYAAPGGQGVNWTIGGTPHASTGVPSFGTVLEHPSGFPIVWTGFGAYVEHVDPMESFITCVRDVIVTGGAAQFTTEWVYVLIDGEFVPVNSSFQPLPEVSPATDPKTYVGEQVLGTHLTAQVPTGAFDEDDVEYVYGYGPLNGNDQLEPCEVFLLSAPPALETYEGYVYNYDTVLFEFIDDLPIGTEANLGGRCLINGPIVILDEHLDDDFGSCEFGIVSNGEVPFVRNCGMYTVDLLPQQNVYTINADGYTDDTLGISCFSDVNVFEFPPAVVSYSNALPDRIGGANRHETANNIGFNVSPCAHTVVLVNGNAYPDALSASYLAGALREIFLISQYLAEGLLFEVITPDVPILTTGANSLHSAARIAITEMGAQRVYIVGGPDVVSPDVEAQIAAMPRTNCGGVSYLPHAQNVDVRRVAGANRYATNAAVVQRVQSIFAGAGNIGFARYNDRIRDQLIDGESSKRTAIIATGEAFADALSAGPLSYNSFPLILTPTNGALHPSALNTLTAIEIEQVIIMGETAAISAATEAALRAIPSIGDRVIRIGGANRYETNVAFLEFLRAPDQWDAGGVPLSVSEEDWEEDYDFGMSWPACWGQFGDYPWWDYFWENYGSQGLYQTLEEFGNTAFLARGDDFADALAAAPLVGAGCGSLLLTTPNSLHPVAAEWLTNNSPLIYFDFYYGYEQGGPISNIIALGLAQAISSQTLAQANAALFPPIGP